MKKQQFAVCVFLSFALFILSSCGISSKKKETMQNSLEVTLNMLFLAQDNFVAFAPSVELRNVEKGESPWSTSDGYHGDFSCSFTDEENNVYLVGHVGFDKNGAIVKCDNGKYPIDVSVILVDSKNVPVLDSPYNLRAFGGYTAQ